LSLGKRRTKTRRHRAGGQPLLLLYQRTGALRKRPEGLLSGGRSDQLVIVPRSLGFGRLLDLEQIGWVDLAAILADRALAEQRIVGRHFLHFRDDLWAIMVIAAHGFERLEIVNQTRIDAGLHHARLRLVLRS